MELGEWRQNVLLQLQNRNKRETQCYQDLITQHTKVFENANSLRHENLQLSIQNEKLKLEGGNGGKSSSALENRLNEEVQQLKQKLLVQAEELTDLHRRKGENSQQIIDLNIKLQERDSLIASKDNSLAECQSKILSLKAEIAMLTQANRELKHVNDTLRDEHSTLQLDFSMLEEKLRKTQRYFVFVFRLVYNYKIAWIDHKELKEELKQIRDQQSMFNEELLKLRGENEDNQEIKRENTEIKTELQEVRKTIEIIDKGRRKNNVVMNGLKFDNNEPAVLVEDVKAFLNQQLKVNVTPKTVTRIAERTWIIELQNEADKRKIMENGTKLKDMRGERVFINDDVTKQDREKQNEIRIFANQERQKGKEVKIGFNKDENRQLVERLIKYKAKDADRMNEENDNFLKKRYAKLQKDLEEACKDTKDLCSKDIQEGYGPLSQSTLPSRVHAKFDAHEGEVNAVKWSPLDRLVATGGADRKVKLWDISKGQSKTA
ncbi:unnamed protein product [Ceutorhynchus assimilis]|uniref:Autophagy-related protein 16 domain-containing protein n=1 Tax=Ceutorhynchus assimilis TaxID=467358 RepID=A0A9N9MVP3_9CUCU|nr:unnamed protein product [Ceutorhynchus assimilis]